MSLVDFERAWLDLKRELASKPSHGASALLEAMARLELDHEIDESQDAAVLRRFDAHLVDTFLGLLPLPATRDPITPAGFERTGGAMDEGATPDQHLTEGDTPCPPHSSRPATPSSSHGCSPVAKPTNGRHALAAT